MQYFWIVHNRRNSQEFESLNLGSYLFFYKFSKFADLEKSQTGFPKKNTRRAGFKRIWEILRRPAQLRFHEREKRKKLYLIALESRPKQFFHIPMWVHVLSNGVYCFKMRAIVFYTYIVYKGQLHTPIGAKVYRYRMQTASISLLFL
jgi:hypothetical protein